MVGSGGFYSTFEGKFKTEFSSIYNFTYDGSYTDEDKGIEECKRSGTLTGEILF